MSLDIHDFMKKKNKRAMMALNRSPEESKVVIVQIVCVVEIQSESAWTLTNIS